MSGVNKMALLDVREIGISFTQYTRWLNRRTVATVRDLSLTVNRGEVVALIGASGSGKSLLAHAILGLLPRNASMSGTIFFDGKAMTRQRQAQLRGREIALVPQSVTYLDPLMKVGTQVRHAASAQTGDAAAKQRDLFARYRLAPEVANQYPHQLSGGMARRVLLATAAISGATLWIADEPTPGLDEAGVRETLRLFREHADQGGAVLMITHDLEAALQIADRVAVLHGGTAVEIARAYDFEGEGAGLRHPYTQAMWKALPANGFQVREGNVTDQTQDAAGCPFVRNCPLATVECSTRIPPMKPVRGGMVRCIHAT